MAEVAILKDLLLLFAEHTKVLESDKLFLPGCACTTGLEEPPFRLVPCSSQELQGCSYTGTEDVCKHGFTLQLFSGCVAVAACFFYASVSAETLIDNDNDDI